MSGLNAKANLVLTLLKPKLLPPPNPKLIPEHSIDKFGNLSKNSFSFSNLFEFYIIKTFTLSSIELRQLIKISLLVL